MSEKEKVEFRNIIPILGMNNVGKKTLASTILNLKFLESLNTSIKFTNILRYNPNIKSIQFYKLFFENKTFYKEKNFESVGENESLVGIFWANQINTIGEIDYSNNFYMTEFNELPSYADKSFFLTHDICLVPFFPKESRTKGENIYYKEETNKSALTSILEILKNYIKRTILMTTNENNYNLEENQIIINELYNITKKPLKNFLVILNKIDFSPLNLELEKSKCIKTFLEDSSDGEIFNKKSNTFVALSIKQLENELLLKDNFTHLLKYHFTNYFNYYLQNKNKKNLNSFVSYLSKIFFCDLKLEEQKEIIKELKKDKSFGWMNQEIKESLKEIINLNNEKLEIGINPEEMVKDFSEKELKNEEEKISLNSFDILRLIYHFHKTKKYNQEISSEAMTIFNYFKNEKNQKNKVDTEFHEKIIKKLEDFSLKLENYKDLSNDLCYDLRDKISKAIKYIKFSNRIFIPILGPSNSGKTSFINSIIGENIIPISLKSNNKRGIIIRHIDSNEIILSKIKVTKEKFIGKFYYYLDDENEIKISEDKEKIKMILNGESSQFSESEKEYFFCLSIKIKIFDYLELNDELKKMISFIDFPEVKKIFEENNLNKYLNVSNLFFYFIKNTSIKEKETKRKLNFLYSKTKLEKKQLTTKFLKSCLFIINNDNEQHISKKKIEEAKLNINSIITKVKPSEINLSFYNPNYFYNRIYLKNYFINFENMLPYEYADFRRSIKKSSKSSINFYDYILKKIEDKINFIFNKKVNLDKIIINENIQKRVERHLKIAEQITKGKASEKNKKLLLRYFTFINDNIIENTETFLEQLKTQFLFIYKDIQKDIKNNLNKLFLYFDMPFQMIFRENKKKEVDINSIFTGFIEKIEKLNKKYSTIDKLKKLYFNEIDNIFKEERGEFIKKYSKNNCLKFFEEIVKEIQGIFYSSLNKTINEFSQESSELFSKTKNDINSLIQGVDIIKNELKDFKSIISGINGDQEFNLEKELREEIENSGLIDINARNGLNNFIYSIINDSYYVNNMIDIILNLIKNKDAKIGTIEYYSTVLKDSIEEYLFEIENIIIYGAKSLKIEINEDNIKKWKEIGKLYEETRENIKNAGLFYS